MKIIHSNGSECRPDCGCVDRQLEIAQARVNELEAALRNCDFELDEFGCGAAGKPPRANVLLVPVAVHNAVTAYQRKLAQVRQELTEARAALTAPPSPERKQGEQGEYEEVHRGVDIAGHPVKKEEP